MNRLLWVSAIGAFTMAGFLTAAPGPSVPADVEFEYVDAEPFWDYPLCEVEDASSGPVPCLWPADRVGNGIGNTFYVEPGPDGTRCFRYVNATVEAEMGGCE